MKTIRIAVLLAIATTVLVSCNKEDPKVSVTGVTLDKTELTITVGDPDVKLVATVTPDNATDKTVNWASDKAEAATVDNQGSVHAVAPGEAIITVTTTDGGKTATCTVTVKAALPTGALSGEFSVSANKKVHFSKGNLKYDVKSGEWGFFDKQYEYQKEYSTDLISLFTWGLGDWSTDPATTTYAASQEEFVDWGTVIDDKGTWSTLTKEEWMYILWTRAGEAYDKKVCWSGVKVGDAENCMVIAPDGNTVEIKDTYTVQEWAEVEAAGFVCLPNAGYRGTNTIDFSYGGYYWAASQSRSDIAKTLNFKGADWKSAQDLGKIYPSSVRLVAVH